MNAQVSEYTSELARSKDMKELMNAWVSEYTNEWACEWEDEWVSAEDNRWVGKLISDMISERGNE
jgi:hypothetical protein